MDRVDAIRAFVAVADARSFARGAQRLGVSPAQGSKLVARLEDRLGARLLNRTTRDVSLTEGGEAYLERARTLLEAFDALETSLRSAGEPRGRLKIAAPMSFGFMQLEPVLLDFAAAFPNIGLEVFFSDRMVNLVDEGFDVAVRITRLSDSSLVARKLADVRVVTCASPAYIASHGSVREPADLATRETILDLNVKDPTLWRFSGPAGRKDVRVTGRLRFSSASACLAAARRGWGIARAPAFVASEDLRSGALQAVLRSFEPEPLAIHAVYPHARHLAANVRAFVDFLTTRFAGEPEWHRML